MLVSFCYNKGNLVEQNKTYPHLSALLVLGTRLEATLEQCWHYRAWGPGEGWEQAGARSQRYGPGARVA